MSYPERRVSEPTEAELKSKYPIRNVYVTLSEDAWNRLYHGKLPRKPYNPKKRFWAPYCDARANVVHAFKLYEYKGGPCVGGAVNGCILSNNL